MKAVNSTVGANAARFVCLVSENPALPGQPPARRGTKRLPCERSSTSCTPSVSMYVCQLAPPAKLVASPNKMPLGGGASASAASYNHTP